MSKTLNTETRARLEVFREFSTKEDQERPPQRSARDRTHGVPSITLQAVKSITKERHSPLRGNLMLPEMPGKVNDVLLCTTQHLYFVESRVVNNKDHTKNQGSCFFFF